MDIFKLSELVKDYNEYAKSDEARIINITKYIARGINTKNKWIDAIDYEFWGLKANIHVYKNIVIELFDRHIKPKYLKKTDFQSEYQFKESIRAITWKTANEDIQKQRANGVNGLRFSFDTNPYNRSKGKRKVIYRDHWNEEKGGWDYTGTAPTTTVKREIEMDPDWRLGVSKIKRITD